MRALVTGGAGFMGSHPAGALLDDDDDVTVVDRFSRGHAGNLWGAIRRSMGVVPIAAPARPGEVYRSCLGTDRARILLSWQARTRLRDGIERMLVPCEVTTEAARRRTRCRR